MAEKEGDLDKGFAALWELFKAAAEGDEMAKLALGTLNNMQLARNQNIRLQQEIEAHRGILKAMTGGGEQKPPADTPGGTGQGTGGA